MFALGALSFIAPIALFGLIALPVIYWLLRVIPPAPRRVRFPARASVDWFRWTRPDVDVRQ